MPPGPDAVTTADTDPADCQANAAVPLTLPFPVYKLPSGPVTLYDTEVVFVVAHCKRCIDPT